MRYVRLANAEMTKKVLRAKKTWLLFYVDLTSIDATEPA